MEKFKKFCKKPLRVISIWAIVLCTLGLIITGAISHANANYKYSETFMGIELNVELDFKGNKVICTESALGETMSVEGSFIIKDGKLLVKGEGETTYEEMGEIDAYNFTMKVPLDETDPSAGYITIKCECGITHAFRTINIIMIVAGTLGIISSIVYTWYEKNKAETSSSEATEESAEN